MKSTAPMKNNLSANSEAALRYGMFIPLALMIASIITCCFSYSNAKQTIANDLNDAMFVLANENSELWTRPDTIAAIRHMYETTHKPLIYQASDVNFRNPSLKDEAYFTLALVDTNNGSHRIGGNKIASDSIIIMPKRAADGLAIQVQGFATVPWLLFSLPRTRHCREFCSRFLFSQWQVCLFGKERKPRHPKQNLLLFPLLHRLMVSNSLPCSGSWLECFLKPRAWRSINEVCVNLFGVIKVMPRNHFIPLSSAQRTLLPRQIWRLCATGATLMNFG